VSKHVQVSRNITFDSNDTRLFPIPDKDFDDTDLIVLLGGESQPHERAMDPTPAIDVTTPQTTAALSPNPSAQGPEELTLQRSNRNVARPNYQLLNDPGDWVLVTQDALVEPDVRATLKAVDITQASRRES